MNRIRGTGKWGIAKNIMITVLIIAFFVSTIVGFYHMLYEERYKNIITGGEVSAGSVADQIDKYLSTNIDSIKLSAYTLDEMLEEGRSDEEIQDFLVGQSTAIKSAVMENSTGLYAYINGRFFSGTNWTPPEDYDATTRPWYTKPLSNPGNITMLDPYVDVQSGNIMLAIGKTLCDGVSVVSVDVSLDRIQEITKESVDSRESDIEMILNDKGIVVAHSDIAESGKGYSLEKHTFGSAMWEHLGKADSDHFEFDYLNSRYIVYAASLMDNWYCVSIKNATTTFSSIRLLFGFTVAAVVIVIVITCLVMINSNRRQLEMERLGKQISATADIYISMHEINLLRHNFIEIRNSRPDKTAQITREMRMQPQEVIRALMTDFTAPSYREAALDFVDLDKLDERLKERETITCEWMGSNNKWRKSRFIVSERTHEGEVARVLYLIEDIDAERKERDKAYDTAQQLGFQLKSIANIYTSVHDIDLLNDSFAEINTTDTVVENVIGKDVAHAQKVLQQAMIQLTDESCKAQVLEFIEFGNIKKNVAETGTATIEFLNSRGWWCRGRFIASERTEDGSVSHVIWAVENIDEEKRKRDRLTAAAETLNARLSSIANIYMTAHEVDILSDTFEEIRSQSDAVNGIIGEIRTNAQQMLCKVMESVTGESYKEDVLRFVDLSTLDRRMRNTDTITLEYRNRNNLWIRGRFVASRRSEDGKLIRVLWLSENIDNEKNERDKLLSMSERAVAANEAKSSFLSNMSGAIRTPINTVLKKNGRILRESTDKDILPYAADIQAAGHTLLSIVNNILDYSRIEAGKMEIVPVSYDLSHVLGSLVSVIRAGAYEKGLKLVLQINREIPRRLNGDETHIRQVIMNLLSNAVKFTEKGTITFCVDYERLSDEPDRVLLDISVMDTGIGMEKEELELMFPESVFGADRESHRSGGKGLGLNITRCLLEMMGSKLDVESVSELGSKFSFRLKQTVVEWEELGDLEAVPLTTEDESVEEQEKPVATGDEKDPDLEADEMHGHLAVLAGAGIDTEAGIKNSGSNDAYLSLLKIFYDAMEESTGTINHLYEEEDWKNYIIKVHGLKSSARIIGATTFGEKAQALEDAGKAEELDYIRAHHQELMDDYQRFYAPLSGLFPEEEPDEDKMEVDEEYMKEAWEQLRSAADKMDCDLLEEIVLDMRKYRIPKEMQELFEKVADAVDNFDYEGISKLLNQVEHI